MYGSDPPMSKSIEIIPMYGSNPICSGDGEEGLKGLLQHAEAEGKEWTSWG